MFGAKGIETGVAPLPAGPSGKRASMYNGLADSIWVGSKNKPAAAKVGRVPRVTGLPEHCGREGRRLPGHPRRH
jgi:multiple sugar transport system substrate-binding protein